MADAGREVLSLLEKIWSKLQGLPTASPLEIGAFCVLILFILVFLGMLLMTCVTCCCCGRTRTKDAQSQLTREGPHHP
uniref:Small integral membrane protein 5 n=1 Tax=Esox lucius TaxID=8010 RepID=A0AAY5LBE5_ESOLU